MNEQKRVLIVDSDEQILITLEHLLEDQGIDTTTTWSARQALELLRSHGFNMLLVGDHLADLTSEQLLREIQMQGVDASILVMESSGSRVPSLANHFAALGATATVRKRDYGQVLQQVSAIAAIQEARRARAA